MTRRVAIFTRSEADYHLLHPLIMEVRARKTLRLQLLVGGEHLSPRYGRTVAMIQADDIPINRLLPVPLCDDMAIDADQARSATMSQVGRAIEELGPDILLLSGGDPGAMGAGDAARGRSLPLALVHMCDGRAAVCSDDHLIESASVHFVPSDIEAGRLRDHGVSAERIQVVGALESDAVHRLCAMERERLEEDFGFLPGQRLLLVAWQPDPAGRSGCEKALKAMLAAFDQLPRASLLFLGDRTDPDLLRQEVDAFIARNPERARLLLSPGRRRQLSLLRAVDAVVGNADLGRLEAKAAATPSVQVLCSQPAAGADGLFPTSSEPDDIVAQLRAALAPGLRERLKSLRCPVSDGKAAERIADSLESLDLQGCGLALAGGDGED